MIFEAAMNKVCAHPAVTNAPQYIVCKIIGMNDCDHSFSAYKFCNDDKFCQKLTIDTVSFAS